MTSDQLDVSELSREELMAFALDTFRRTIAHYGMWLREVEYQLGMERAEEVEQAVFPSSLAIQMKRLSKIFGFELDENGLPKKFGELSKEQLLELAQAQSINWLANDGVWFQAVEKQYGMDYAKRVNDSCWTHYSPYEAARIKRLLNLSARPGLAGLKKALALRTYAMVNEQSIEDDGENAFIFRMNKCRVQDARKRKGLPDYPCHSVGNVEYPYFARAIDSRIETKCVGCPPDAHPEEWYCAWRFVLKEED